MKLCGQRDYSMMTAASVPLEPQRRQVVQGIRYEIRPLPVARNPRAAMLQTPLEGWERPMSIRVAMRSLVLPILVAVPALPAVAHHSFAMFDNTRSITLH